MVLTIPQVVRATAKFGEREALVDGSRRWSFVEVVHEIELAARAFIARGLEHGDRVAIWAPNSAEWIFAALGAQLVGGVLVPINTRFKGHEAAYVIERSGAKFLFCCNDFLGTNYVNELRQSNENTECLSNIIVISGEAENNDQTWTQFITHGSTTSNESLTLRESQVQPNDLCDIIFTSGTTGKPKGVMSRHDQTIRVFLEWSEIVGLNETDRYLIVNPFFHTFGYKAGFLACLLRGATMLPVPVFDIPAVLQKISDEKISAIPGPPTLYLTILNHPDRANFDLSSLRLAVTGAAAVPVEMIKRMREELNFEVILTAYGLTESTGTVTMCRAEDDPVTISTTSGRAITDVEVRIVDENNIEVSRGQSGEIVCRGYNVMPGYFADPEATAQTIDADGWLHTGDIGIMDARGYVAITDRLKDMFIVGGFNAYPAEIENEFMNHPAIAQVAIVGQPDERMGEVGHAFVVVRHDQQIDRDELQNWARHRMANFKVPRYITFVDVLPTNASGKVLKYELRNSVN
ncbi:MAG: AMP-binding protein [Actinobacteria bacterium]|nr:AMP-binding protein [Actinomycetota bacterium]MUH57192.1 AMP-binding protein [Actinomycetota bacterium]